MNHSVHVNGVLHDYQCTCMVRLLPRELWREAAETAIAENPSNAPSFRLHSPVENGVDLPPEFLAVVTKKYWGPAGIRLTVGFMDSPPSDLRARILFHMNAWGGSANVGFVESNVDPQVRIAREPTGYWSNLGTDILHVDKNKQTMNLQAFTINTPDSEFYRVVRHETGHTLGFPHEHTRGEIVSRIDRGKAIEYFKRTMGWEEPQVVSQVLTPQDNSALIASAKADPNSIMCYWLPASIMSDKVAVPGGSDIDQQDREFAQSIYPVPRQTAIALASYRAGIFTAFDGGGVYFSPDGESLGGGGHTKLVYGPGQRVCALAEYSNGLLTAFDGGAVYFSSQGDHIGGGGSTEVVYGPGQRVTALLLYKGGVLTAFEGGGIYFSPDGKSLGGGGATTLVYGPGQRVLAMTRFRDGVLTAFSGGGIYFSPDGHNLGGGGSTELVYGPGQRVRAITYFRDGVLTAFEGGGIYFSLDVRSLGGGGSSTLVYGPGQKVTAMVNFAGGVMTAFDGKGVYFSPTGRDLGGGGSTVRVY